MSDDYLRQQQQQQQQQHNRQAQQQHRQQRQQQPLPHSSPPPPLSGSPLLPPPPPPQALASPLAAAAAAAASASDFPPRRHQQQQQVQAEEHERRQQQQQHQHFSGFPLQHTVSGFVTATGLDTGDGQPREDVTGRTSALLSSSCFPSLASVQASLSALPSHGWESALSGRQQQQQQAGLSHQLSSDMQQGSLLGTRVSIPAFGSGRSALAGAGVNMGAIGTGMPGLMHQSPHQSLHYDHLEQHPPVMDELLDQMFSLPSWSDIGGRSTLPWDFNAGGTTTAMDVGSVGPLHGSQKLFTMSLMPPGVMAGSFAGQGMQEGSDNPRAGVEMMHYSTDDTILASRLPQQHGLQDHSGVLAAGPARLQRSPSVGSSGSEGSAGQPHRDQSPPPIAPTWRQPYVGGVPPLPMTLTQNKGEAGNTEALRGKRGREDDEISRDNRSGRDVPQGPFGSFGVAHLGQSPLLRQQSHQQGNPTSQGLASVQAQVYVTQATPAHQGTGPGVPAVARPRVRARRGQATDPHSIAERLRRERIAERMKALQELVPNSNKTDKASMLDEIIDYVKFLQLQVKVLSMSRLGGAGAVAPLVADLPAEGPSSFVAATIGRSGGASGPPSEGLALTERQVARLMEEDMGTAMQYLQSKGLCLMPISLATAISSNGPRPQTAGVQGASGQGLMAVERQRPEQSAVVCSGPPATGSAAADKGRPPRDNRDAGDISGESSKSPKHTADSPRRQ